MIRCQTNSHRPLPCWLKYAGFLCGIISKDWELYISFVCVYGRGEAMHGIWKHKETVSVYYVCLGEENCVCVFVCVWVFACVLACSSERAGGKWLMTQESWATRPLQGQSDCHIWVGCPGVLNHVSWQNYCNHPKEETPNTTWCYYPIFSACN